MKEKKKVIKKEKNTNPKKISFWKGFKLEIKKVKWPERKEVVKYTKATIIFVCIFVGLFTILGLLMSYIKGLFI